MSGGTLYAEITGVCPPEPQLQLTGRRLAASFQVSSARVCPHPTSSVSWLKIQSEGGRRGNENYDIYALAAAQTKGSSIEVFRHDIPGNNSVYKTAPGYNLVLGNGTVVGNTFVRGPTLSTAGIPQTPTNP